MASQDLNRDLNGLNPLAYLGVNPTTPPQLVTENRAPTVNDYVRFPIGTIWLYTATNSVWILTNKTGNVATWTNLSSGVGIVTLDGDTGTATGSTINILGTADQITTTGNNVDTITIAIPTDPILDGTVTTTGTFALPETTATAGQIILGGNPFIHSYGGESTTDNTFIGSNSGNFTFDPNIDPINSSNTAVGNYTLHNMNGTLAFEAEFNTTVGNYGLLFNTTGGFNTAIGSLSMSSNVSGSCNTAVGAGCLTNLVSGSFNTILGWHSGFNYNGAESSNIIIGYTDGGVVGESNVLRIGIDSGTGDGEIDEAYISGIYNRVVDPTSTVVLCDVNNKVGGLPDGNFGDVLTQGLTGPEWQPGGGSTMIINPQITDYTLELVDNGALVTMDITTTANTVTVPLYSSVAFPVGSVIWISQLGTGVTQIIPVSGAVTINSVSGASHLFAQYSVCSLVNLATNVWLLSGDII